MADLRRSLLKKRTINRPPSSIDDDEEEGSGWGKRERTLYYLNVAEFSVHFASFIAALIVSIIYAGQSYQTELRTDFLVNQSGTFQTDCRSLGYYPIIWADLPFPIITALFHGVIAFVPQVWIYYCAQVFDKGANPLRWAEYSITASLMTWVILQLSGVTNIFILVVVGVVMNMALQWQGYAQEQVKNKTWAPTATGWLIFAGQWTIILAYFFTAVASDAAVPWFVYSIIIGLFGMFSFFGLVQLSGLMCGVSPYAQEIAYSILSLTAKLFLTWNLLIGVALRHNGV